MCLATCRCNPQLIVKTATALLAPTPTPGTDDHVQVVYEWRVNRSYQRTLASSKPTGGS